jgi:hypothetical protein
VSVANPLRQLLGADEARGRVVTVLAPEGYVLVDGLLLRAMLAAGHARIGEGVLLRPGDGTVLAAYGTGADGTGADGTGADGTGADGTGDGHPGEAP